MAPDLLTWQVPNLFQALLVCLRLDDEQPRPHEVLDVVDALLMS
jgi:hypothetical protein